MEKEVENFDMESLDVPMQKVEIKAEVKEKVKSIKKVKKEEFKDTVINCLRNERIIVKLIPRETGLVTNPKHVLYGGMAEGSTRTFVVPRLTSGMYVNVLTDEEKECLEEVMGLEYNALSIYKRRDNFWDDSNDIGISKVTLYKQDNYFNLADPEDYIRYKILLANKDFIAPSLQVLQDKPKATYQFVIVREGDESKKSKIKMSATMECYTEFGAIKDDIDKLRVIVETLDGRPTSMNSKLEFLQNRINTLIQADSSLFLNVIKDSYLDTKVLIKQAIEGGIISNRGGMLYLMSDNSPLCENNEEPTFNIAAKYLSAPKHQDIMFAIQAKLKV